MADKSQQTEKPTQRKLEKARKEGQFPVSKEFVHGVSFLVFVLLLGSYGRSWLAGLVDTSKIVLHRSFQVELTPNVLRELLYILGKRLVYPLMIAGAVIAGSSLAVHLAVTRLGFAFNKLAPDLTRLNPAKALANAKRQNLTGFVQALVLLPVFSLAVYFIARDNLPAFMQLPFQAVDSGLKRVASSINDLLWKAVYLFLIWGSIDLFRQTKRFHQEMRMSKQEIRDEAKESDGNPQVKQRIRRLQKEALRRRMMSQVPTATAVIVNPTHFAVAIRYHMESMSTPVVVAKGKNYLALRIRQIAIENLVPIVENPPLAQALYASVEVGQEIPANFYRAIAEILAYIYKLRGKRQ
jgi:flagellar biosynthetic protein FlhB